MPASEVTIWTGGMAAVTVGAAVMQVLSVYISAMGLGPVSHLSRWVRAVMLFLALAPALAWASRPLDTEDTGTVAPGKAELELSGDYATSSAGNVWGLKGVLSAGLLPRLEARIESTLLLLEPVEQGAHGGIGDSLFGVKYRLLDESASLPAVLGSFTLRLPTGDAERGLGVKGVDVGLLAVMSKAVGPVTLTWNGGYTFVSQSTARARDLDVWILAGAIEYRATEAWTLVGELVSALGTGRAPDIAVLRVGHVYAITDRIKVDGAVGLGVTRESPDVVVTVGATIALF